ncbi:hypothetical protein BCD64_04255 [Nostoc sp. MBR 210]|nr:hypothetical protein BCD64_04255 [Nostoc sp. MBR 210]
MTLEKIRWFQMAFQLKGSVVSSIYQRVLWCGLFGFIISVLHYLGWPVSKPMIGTILPSLVLGLLLVFRTNTAYERFWEGRRCWGNLVNTTRNLARQVWVTINEKFPEDRDKKIATLRLIIAFSFATKLHLRGERENQELKQLMSNARYNELSTIENLPLEVAFWISDYLQEQYNRDCLHTYQLINLQELLNILVDNLGSCERILKTPMPLAYAIHLKQLLLVYCCLLPLQIVDTLGWWTGFMVAVVSFTLFGVEAIGLEIENPFGYDDNDLPLDAICNTIKNNIEDLITTQSNAARSLQNSTAN